jgi:hypothetical protein
MYITNLPGVTIPEARGDRDWETALDYDHIPPFSVLTDDGERYAAFNIKDQKARKAPTLTVRQDTWSFRDGTALVINTKSGARERPRVHELERMVGLLEGATAAEGVSEEQRRQACGDVIDRHVLTHLLQGLAFPAAKTEKEKSASPDIGDRARPVLPAATSKINAHNSTRPDGCLVSDGPHESGGANLAPAVVPALIPDEGDEVTATSKTTLTPLSTDPNGLGSREAASGHLSMMASEFDNKTCGPLYFRAPGQVIISGRVY